MLMSNYPTLEQIESASYTQICIWWRFLASPGLCAVGHDNFEEVLEAQTLLMNAISERFYNGGGMTPEISKEIGWILGG